MNKSILIGRLTRDPDLRMTQNNIAVGNFNLAVNRPYTDQNGEKITDFINIVVFKKQAENVQKYLSKGSQCAVEGFIQTRNYENKEGQRIYVTEVVAERVRFLDTKNNNQRSQSNAQQSQQYSQPQTNYGQREENPYANAGGGIDISDDDMPF